MYKLRWYRLLRRLVHRRSGNYETDEKAILAETLGEKAGKSSRNEAILLWPLIANARVISISRSSSRKAKRISIDSAEML